MKTAPDPPTDETSHSSVMLEETVSYLNPRPGKIYVDATLGMGGHSEAILSSVDGVKVIGIDSDPDSVEAAKKRLERFGERIEIVNSNFTGIEEAARSCGALAVDGIIADLGISSRQLEGSGRGFSFTADEPLDMRMNPASGETAADIVNTLPARELAGIIKKYGEEKFASKIANAIARSREEKPLETARELALIVAGSIPVKFHPPRTHPATRVFQALRIHVNDEISSLEIFLQKAVPLLSAGSRIVIISFHSLEDRVVKRAFNLMNAACICPPELPMCGCGKSQILKVIERKPVLPGASEVRRNPRARSSKMRVAEKI
ncbi:MAG: 16S rRNA (cytosine(1402)-N(4))-methyltransferase RsmH [Candidatus Mycalebacterium zealandia]|nr:MAG: 16S rRNA (cytosine(1402)-N(4))-methyltransferase RsmH [Candidatus Mycalebacterium zealandia]